MLARRAIAPILTVLLFMAAARGQTADPHPAFEVASVKPSPPPGAGRGATRLVRGGPGSTDPGSAMFTYIDLFSLVTMAYGVKPFQLSGPDWLRTARFDITAKIPPGTDRPQYRLMLQDLLASRFKLALHLEKKELPGYELVVAKNGPKLKESAEDSAAVDDSLQPPLTITPPPGYNRALYFQFAKCSMERLAGLVSASLNQAVSDGTGLTGKYDIKLHYTFAGIQAGPPPEPDAASSNPDPNIFDALPEQLGLKLVAKKGPVDILVIDRIEKVPTEN